MPPNRADISALLRALEEREVEFIVVGGVCAVIHGAPVSTFDLDIVAARTDANISRLMEFLSSVDAVHRDPAGRTIRPAAPLLLGSGHVLLMTSAGPLDIRGEIGAHRDYAALLSRSRRVELGEGLVVRVLDLDALIETKREAGREKDLATLPILRRTLAESKQDKR